MYHIFLNKYCMPSNVLASIIYFVWSSSYTQLLALYEPAPTSKKFNTKTSLFIQLNCCASWPPSWPRHWFFLRCWIVDQWWRLLLGMSGGPSQSEWHARSASLGLHSSNDTRGSPASTQLLHPRVMVRPGKLPRRFILHRYRPLKISPSLLLSITFVPGHLHLHRLLEVRGLCSPTLLWFVSLCSSVAPNRGFFILLFFDRHFLLGPVAFHLHFYNSVFSSSVLNCFGLLRSLDLHTSVFRCLLLPFLCYIFLYTLASLRSGP
jgi:hypothetical protein